MSGIQHRRYRMTDGVEIAADIAGSPGSPTVILMHGGGQTRYSWSSAVNAMTAAGYRVINYDARGHGESSWSPDGIYAFDIYSRDLQEIARDLDGHFALIGASLGGATSIHAVNSGLRPDAVVLVDIIPHANPEGVARIRAFMSGHPDGFISLDEAAEAVAGYNPFRPKPRSHEGLRKNLRQRENGRFYWHWDPRILAGDQTKQIASLARAVEEFASRTAIPTLLVRGGRSDVVTDSGIEDFRRLLPALEVAEVAEAGHMVAGDQNDSFNASVLEYLLRQVPPGSDRGM